MKKKIMTLALSAVMAVSLAACGAGEILTVPHREAPRHPEVPRYLTCLLHPLHRMLPQRLPGKKNGDDHGQEPECEQGRSGSGSAV